MKRIETFLSEQEYKAFIQKAEEFELSEYSLLKQAILHYLFGDVSSNSNAVAHSYIKKVKALKHQQKWAFALIFVLSLYFVVSLTYILLF